MKKSIFLKVIISITILNFSCSKKESLPQSTKANYSSINRTADTLESMNLPLDVILNCPDDMEYEKIDIARYTMGNAMRYFINSEISNSIYSSLISSGIDTTIDVVDVLRTFPDFKDSINSYLHDNVIENVKYQFKTIDEILAVLSHNEINYTLAFYIPHIEKFIQGSVPALSPGCDIAVDDEDQEDRVLAWDIVPTNTLNRNTTRMVSLLENDVINGANLLVLSLRDLNTNIHSNPVVHKTTSYPWANKSIRMKYIKITTRHEKNGPSEVYLAGRQLIRSYNTGSASFIWDYTSWNSGYTPTANSWDHLATVKKKEINTNRGVSMRVAKFVGSIPIGWTSGELMGTMWNTFERDWWESKKNIGFGNTPNTINGVGVRAISVNVTFSDDVYLDKPGNCNENAQWYIDEDVCQIIWNNSPGQITINGIHSSMVLETQ